MSTYVARCEDAEGAVFAYAFALLEGEEPVSAAQDTADVFGMSLIETMTIEDFIYGGIYELCTT